MRVCTAANSCRVARDTLTFRSWSEEARFIVPLRAPQFYGGMLPTLARLTPQPFLPKLRHIKHMHRRTTILAIVVALAFLGMQFHFCADMNGTDSSHSCPVCSATSSAMAMQALLLVIAPVSHRLETTVTAARPSIDVPRAISPRAPPNSLP